MTATTKLYASAFSEAMKGNHKWKTTSGDTYKVALLTASDIANVNTHTQYSDLASEVASGGGYTTGGATITTTDPTITAANSWGTSRANTTAYNVGDVVRPSSGNGFVYQCVAAGNSGSSIPTYPTVVGQTVTDGTVTWVCAGESVVQFTGGTASWTGTISAVAAVVYDSTSGKLLCIVDFGTTIASTGGAYTVTPNTLGWAILFPA